MLPGRVTRSDLWRPLGLPPRIWFVAAAVLSVVIAVASLLPPRGTPGVEIADLGELRAWIGHAIGYLLLTATALLAQRVPRPWLTLGIASLYGVLLEIAQGVLGQRSAQLSDVVANVAGALLGLALAHQLLRRRT